MTKLLFALGLLLLVGIHAALVMSGATPVLSGAMPDTDTYMRLVRVEALVNGQSWFDSTVTRMNAPYGDVLNWTRPLDGLIILGAWPLVHVASWNWHDAIFWSGALLPVVLHLLFASAVAWAALPLLPRSFAPLVMLMTALQPYLFNYNVVGRPDHQTLLLLSTALLIGGVVRTERAKPAFLGGLAAGFGLWVSTEMEFSLAVVTLTLALLWLRDGDKRWLIAVKSLSLGTLILTVIGFLAERGFDVHTRELDKISISQVLGVAVLCALACVMASLTLPDKKQRLRTLALAGAAALGWIWMLAPELLRGPAGDIDPRVMDTFFLHIREMRPLWPDTLENTGYLLLCLSAPLTGLALFSLLRLEPAKPWLIVASYTLAFTMAGLLHARFSLFASIFAAVFLIEGMRRAGDALRPHSVPLAAVVQVVILLAPNTLGLLVASRTASAETSPANCSIQAIAPALAQLPPGIIMADLNDGPEILYRTAHSVVAGPYHRNRDGILDSEAFFRSGTTDSLTRRGISYVLLCPTDHPDFAEKHGTKGLTPLPLLKDTDFLLYHVDLGALNQ